MNIIYNKETKDYGNDCIIYKSVFVIEVENGYIATKSTIYQGSWCGFDTKCQSFLNDAIKFCEGE